MFLPWYYSLTLSFNSLSGILDDYNGVVRYLTVHFQLPFRDSVDELKMRKLSAILSTPFPGFLDLPYSIAPFNFQLPFRDSVM